MSINLSVALRQGGLHMAIDDGIEKRNSMDIWKSNIALLQMAIADFSIVRTYLIGLLSQAALRRFWMLQKWLVHCQLLEIGRRFIVLFNHQHTNNILFVHRWIVKSKFQKA